MSGIYALDAARGVSFWGVHTGGPLVAQPERLGGVVDIGSSESHFWLIDLASAGRLWSYDGIDGFVQTKPLSRAMLVGFGAGGCRLTRRT